MIKSRLCYGTCMILIVATLCVSGCINGEDEAEYPSSLMVYCGAGMRKPMADIGEAFEETYGIAIDYNFAGSNALLSQMEITERGDCYMPGETMYIEVAQEKGFIVETLNICYHVPIITVPRGNPANIHGLEDLAREGVTLVWGDPQVAAIGATGVDILQDNGLYEAAWANVIATLPTMNEVMMQIAMGQADASINWWDTVKFVEDIEVVHIPVEQNSIEIIPIGTLTFSEYPDAAQLFIEFVSSDTGLGIFEGYGFTTYPDPMFEDL